MVDCHGIYHSDPFPPFEVEFSPEDRYCLYLALLPSGLFLRALAPARGFDLRPHLRDVSEHRCHQEPDRPHPRFRTGRYEVDGYELHLRMCVYLGREVHEQRWSLRMPAPHVLVGACEVYWLTAGV
jgi:hypothetical protein